MSVPVSQPTYDFMVSVRDGIVGNVTATTNSIASLETQLADQTQLRDELIAIVDDLEVV